MPALESTVQFVLDWIRDPTRDPAFLPRQGEATQNGAASEVVSRFLRLVSPYGFALDLVNNGTAEQPAWAGHWTYRGYSFEGFKQPRDATGEDEARLLACAALLKNDWCTARLQ